MGQTSSAPEGAAQVIKDYEDYDFTDDGSNVDSDEDELGSCDDVEASSASSSLSSSSSSCSESASSDSSTKSDGDYVSTSTKSYCPITNDEETTATKTTTNHTSNTQQQRQLSLLPKPSTPAQWISSFRTSTDEELVSLLEETSNGGDLTPLCAQLRDAASRIKNYRALEHALQQSTPQDPATEPSSGVCFYKPSQNASLQQQQQPPPHDKTKEDDELIALCERILKVSLSRGKQLGQMERHRERLLLRQRFRHGSNGVVVVGGERKTSPMWSLSRVRQKLVPSKLKEHVFWESLWVVLLERQNRQKQRAFFKAIEDSANHVSEVLISSEKKKRSQDESELQSQSQSRHTTTSKNEPQIDLLQEQLKIAWEFISELTVRNQTATRQREQMEDLVERLWEMVPTTEEEAPKKRHVEPEAAPMNGSSNSNNDESTSALSCVKSSSNSTGVPKGSNEKENEQPQDSEPSGHEASLQNQKKHPELRHSHSGTWELSKDSIEFLAFPSEAKEALRTEKQKRLKRVREEMAFILDTDDVQDSHGKWSCCHKTNYNDDCGCPRATT